METRFQTAIVPFAMLLLAACQTTPLSVQQNDLSTVPPPDLAIIPPDFLDDLCEDGMRDGVETDVDCGGGTCKPCDEGKMCIKDSDCATKRCLKGICRRPARPIAFADPTSQQTLLNGASAIHLAAADFNNDGKLDIATTDVSVLLGNGDTTLQPALNVGSIQPTWQPPPNAADVQVIALSGSQWPDIIAPTTTGHMPWGHDVDLFINQALAWGSGQTPWSSPRSFSAAAPVSRLAVGDLNRDGVPDVVAANDLLNDMTTTDGDTIAVLLGQFQGGGLLLPVTYGCPVGPRDVLLADFNGDGALDVLVATHFVIGTSETDELAILLNKGDGTFTSTGRTAIDFLATLAVADLDQDGHMDVVAGGFDLNGEFGLMTFRGNGDGTLQTGVSASFPHGLPTPLAVADFDGDSLPDVMLPYAQEPRVNGLDFLAGDGRGGLLPEVPLTKTNWGGISTVSAMIAVDLDNDGRPDVVEAGSYNQFGTAVAVFRNISK